MISYFIVEDRKMKCVMVFAAVMGMLSSLAVGATIVNDHFNDGAIGTNTMGIGTGFSSDIQSGGAAITESGTTVALINNEVAWARAMVASNQGAVMGSASSFQFNGVSFSQSPNGWDWGGSTDRLALGVQEDGVAYNFDNGMKTGFWIQFESDSLVTGVNSQFNGISTLFYNSSTDVKTKLATWSFDTLNWDDWANRGTFNFTPVLNIALALDGTGYSLDLQGDTITLLSGSLSGTFASAGITNELTVGHAFAFAQTENPSLTASIDQIVITGIPEPATLALLGLGGLLLRRKK